MKKSTKFISVILALMLAACSFAVMPFAANAAETAKLSSSDTVTDDATTKDAVVDHIELIKLPDKTNYIQGVDFYLDFDGLEFNVNYADGRTEHIICENGKYICENGEYSDIEAHCYTFDGEEVDYFGYLHLPVGKNTFKLSCVVYNKNSDTYERIEFAEYEFNIVGINHIELTKLPDKTNYTQGYDYYLHLDGLEYNVYYTDGTTEHIICENGVYSDNIEAHFYTSDGEEVEYFEDLPLGKNTVKLTYTVDTFDFIEIAEYEINKVVIDHIELTKLPDKTEYIKGVGTEDFSLAGLEYNVYFNDGSTEHIIGEYSDYLDIFGQYYTSDGEKETYFDDLPLGKNTVKLEYQAYGTDHSIEFAEYEINIVEDPNVVGIKSIEMIQLPDKVFTTECLVNGEPDNYGIQYYQQYYENSLWSNMNGAKMKITFTDGTTNVYDFITEYGHYPVFAYKTIPITVTDLGGFKAEVKLAGHTTVFEAKHTGSDNNGNNTTPTNPTDATNGNSTTPTSSQVSSPDTATPDTVTNGSSGSAVTGNGTVATGSTVYSMAAIIILVCACGVMVFLNRKKYFKR